MKEGKRESIAQIRSRFLATDQAQWPALFAMYQSDGRAGVQSLIKQKQKQLDFLASEEIRLEKMSEYERHYAMHAPICGIDEAGRGPLAGPVVAAAVILPENVRILYLDDSKKLSPSRREMLYDEILEKALCWGVGMVSPERIDEINILQADYEAMRCAVSQLAVKPGICLNDAVTIPDLLVMQVPIIHGDALSISIAAASVVAKVTRDRLMEEYDLQYPEYGFAAHKGYGTAAHIRALQTYGPCPIHRKTFIHHFVTPGSKGLFM